MIYQIKKCVSIFLSKLRWMGWKHPFWFVLGPRDWKLDGEDFRKIAALISVGDIVITRVDGFVSTWILPGWWNHAGVCSQDSYYSDADAKIVHSTAKGVHVDYLYDFMRADHIIVLSPRNWTLNQDASLLATGYAQAAVEYDFDFDFTNPGKFSCTELAAACYPETIKAREGLFGRKILTADDIVALTEGDDAPFYVNHEIRN